MNQLPQTKPLDQFIGSYIEAHRKHQRPKKCCISNNQDLVDHLRFHLLNEKGVKLSLLMSTAGRTHIYNNIKSQKLKTHTVYKFYA